MSVMLKPVSFLTLLAVALTNSVHSDTVSIATQGAIVAYGKTGEFAFIAPSDYKSARLVLSVRMDSPECSGSTHVLRIRLNQRIVRGALDRSSRRLLNKPMTVKMASGLEIPWVRGADWRVAYAPDFEILGTDKAGANRILDVSAHRLVLDVTDLIARGKVNCLCLEHLGESMKLRSYFPKINPSLDFVFDELAMDFSQEPPIQGATPTAEKFHADRIMLQPPATVDVQSAVAVESGGGMRIDLKGLPLHVVSRFSCQGGGFNVLSVTGSPAGESQWKVSVERAESAAFVNASAREYRLERTVRFLLDHVEVADRLTNLTDATIGLAFDNHVVSPATDIQEAWLGGNPDPAVNRMNAMENASVFVAGNESGCGLLAVDDVYRIQAVLYYDRGAGAQSETFALGPNDTYTLRWSLYPVVRPDYYDFINLARRDLGVNFTVPGGFQFGLGAATDEDSRAMAELRALKFLSSGVWFDRKGDVKCYHGEHMLQASSLREQLNNRCATIRRVVPDVRSLIYIHAYINTDPRGPEKHPDARITNEDGSQYENKGYTQSTGIPFLYNYPAADPDNSYPEAMKRVIDMCLDKDKIGADGIYWDELDWISPRYTFDRWDGRSAELDEQHRVKREMSYIHLLSMSAKVKLIEYIFSKGGLLIGNSSPTSDTLMRLHFPRFVETSAEWYPARAHLYTPIALGNHLIVKDFPSLLDDIRLKLMWGSLYYYYTTPAQPYGTITQHMFPFTPVELHRGWLLGKERIITAVPGTFTFGDKKPVKVYWYDAAGKLTEKTGEERVENGRRPIGLELAEREMAAIERRQ